MKPLCHARNSVKKYGGKVEDYLDIHNFFDSSKSAYPTMAHRAIFHSAFGIFVVEKVFGVYIVNSDGKQVSVRDIGEDHVVEDLGFIPTLENYLKNLDVQDWMLGSFRGKKTKVISMKED